MTSYSVSGSRFSRTWVVSSLPRMAWCQKESRHKNKQVNIRNPVHAATRLSPQTPPKKPQTSQNLPKPPKTPQNPKNAVTAGSRKTEVLFKRSVLSHPDASPYQGYIQQVTLYGHMTPSNISSCIMITYQGRLVFYFPRLANNKLTECGNTRSRRSAALQHSNWSCAVHSHSMLVSSKHYCLYWC